MGGEILGKLVMLQKSGYGIVIQVLSTSQCSAVLLSQYNPPFLPLQNPQRWSAATQEMALSMSLQGLHDSDICEYTGISEQLLKRFRSTHRRRLGRR